MTSLSELLSFLHHGNTQIRQIATQALVPYSLTSATSFHQNQDEPIRDLKLLTRDYAPIARDALTILTNLSAADSEILKTLVSDGIFVEVLLQKVLDQDDPTIEAGCGLLANLVKDDKFAERLVTMKMGTLQPPQTKQTADSSNGIKPQVPSQDDSRLVLNLLIDAFTLSTPKSNQYDYLSYLFSDLSRLPQVRTWLLTSPSPDVRPPLSALLIFTTNASTTRRRGVAHTLKNTCFSLSSHETLLRSDDKGLGILPYVLLPLCGPEEIPEEDEMLPELQMLGPEKQREQYCDIIVALVEALLLLGHSYKGRQRLREAGTYYVIRDLHMHIDSGRKQRKMISGSGATAERNGGEDILDRTDVEEGERKSEQEEVRSQNVESVREVCERLVDLLMRDEHPDNSKEEDEDEDEDDHLMEEII